MESCFNGFKWKYFEGNKLVYIGAIRNLMRKNAKHVGICLGFSIRKHARLAQRFYAQVVMRNLR